ncbi:amino acid adenylation domain-containing protein [Paenirhodobacter hankyongi]|uniref:Amino acid adenylation domain-containing protein n=1 Tax=Paenirhodobacter hankyongi TaxID=2294033 RepID=A0A421BUG4_9RHOB|nr:amino acid adenylation domain-containing protein [Sinirhodobacter hankyongi]RLL71952.1 amino acid adenylation domain-containing protein [Sinirhodobacter hankyongi]
MPELTAMQASCWISGHAGGRDPQTPSAHLYVELDSGAPTMPLDPARLAQAFAALIVRHPNLRLSVSAEGRPAIVPPGPAHGLQHHDLRGLGPLDVEAALARLRDDKTHQRLPLDRGLPCEGALSLLPGGRHRLHLDLDMVAADPSCLPALLDELAQLYEDGPEALPETAAPQSAPQSAPRPDPAQEALARDWWRARLDTMPDAPRLPAPHPAPRDRVAHSTRLAATLTPEQARSFVAQARALRVTPSALALALFAQELGRACRQQALRLTVPIFHRDEDTPIIGDASNFTLLGVTGVQDDLPELARRVQSSLVQGITHAAHPGPQLLRDLARHLGRMPEAPVVFTSGLDLPQRSILSERARRVLGDLVWSVSQGPGVALDAQIAWLGTEILLNWDIRLDLLDTAWTEALFARVVDRLRTLAQAPEPPRSWPLAPLQRAYVMGREALLPLGGVAMQETRLFRGALDPAALRARLAMLATAHPALRLRIDAAAGRQHCAPRVEVPFTARDLRDAPDAEAQLAAVWEAFARSPCPLEGALWQVCAVQMPAGQEDALAVKFDALALDGPAIAQICAEILAPTPPEVEDRTEPARPTSVPAAQRRADAAYWEEALARIETAPQLPWHAPLHQLGASRYRRDVRRITGPQVQALRRIAAREKLFLNSLLSFAVLEVLARFTPELRLCVGLPTAPALERAGLANRASFIVIDHAVGPESARDRAAALQTRTMQALAHASVSGVDLARQLLARTGAALALPVVLTNGLSWSAPDPCAPLREVAGLTQTPQVALDLRLMRATEGGIEIAADHAEAALAPETVAAMLDAIVAALAAICTAGALILPEPLVPVPLPPQRAEIPDPAPHLPRIAAHLRADQGTALICGETRLGYDALRRRVEGLLAGLATRGIGPGDVVAIELPRGPDHVALQLATAMAGVIRVPIDAGAPPARRDQLLSRCAPTLVVSQREIAGLACVTPGALSAPDGTLPDDATLTARSLSRDPGYYLFTSGTTGTPKCVVLNNRATASVLEQSLQAWQVTAADVLISVTPLHHDMSVFDVFGALCAGATLVLPEPGHEKDAMDWARLVATHGVTLWVSVPAILEMLIAGARPDQLATLRLVAQGGDYIKPAIIARLRDLLPHARLVSLGGPTETTIWSIWHEIGTEAGTETSAIPYGRALAGAEYRICNPLGEPCPPGVPGRIHTLGDCLALGYLEDGGLVQTDFVPLTEAGGPPRRAFRTGDLGQWRADGVILFAGRVGGYVKVRGVRVSLGEIEAALARVPALRDVMVVDLTTADGRETTLAALYVCRDGAETPPAVLRALLRETLPPSHLPDRFVPLPALPLSANGKPDRAAGRRLATGAPVPPAAPPRPQAPAAASDADPTLVAQVLALYLERLGPREGATADSPLLDLGLLPADLAPMAAALNARFGCALTPVQLLPPRTARAVAALIATAPALPLS